MSLTLRLKYTLNGAIYVEHCMIIEKTFFFSMSSWLTLSLQNSISFKSRFALMSPVTLNASDNDICFCVM